CLQYTNDPFTF
nr:immunoglobulin light chain junction region [Macaca mulatta]MOX84556.1 immunoglobulin light chain junction region [Macaca mulatta]MOX84655.1 immunoglobulin light chain junction region [Macaca mulatta]MOX84757.1 immunoglobulin light chain junction region [Macaca mulatta]MOX85050.1 immunoglobulin light chain junction region [Macaca mulatta]